MIHLTLTEEQAQIVSRACEFYARIRMGQFMEIVYNCLEVKQDHYCEKQEALERVLLHAREYTHPDLERTFGHSYGMGKYEDADRAFDVHQVIRHALGDDREPFSLLDLPKCELLTIRQQWIPVSERLPNEKGEYLVVYHPCRWDNVCDELTFTGVDTFRGKTAWAKHKFQRVTHWMPFPEPPGKDGA